MSGGSFSLSGRLAGLIAVLSVAAIGCGDSDRGYNTGFRPPVTKNITVTIGDKRSEISPRRIGGGPTTITVTNQSGGPIGNVGLKVLGGTGCLSDQADSGPIPDRGTGRVTATLVEGVCELAVDGVGTGRIVVIGERPSAQNKLLLP